MHAGRREILPMPVLESSVARLDNVIARSRRQGPLPCMRNTTYHLSNVTQGLLVQVTYLKDHSLNFILSNTDTSIANALRRAMISEVPTIAIDIVEIEESEQLFCQCMRTMV
jgi:hypothetical protein